MSFLSLPRGVFRMHQHTLKKSQQGQEFIPETMVDMLFDYKKFLAAADTQKSIAITPPATKKSIAIIGSGASGLVAAYELSRIKNIKVTLFEAGDRMGGRMDSIVVPDAPYNDKIFEMGCMRFPPTSYTLFHYLDKFNLKPVPNFPDPGVVPTKLLYQNRVINWPAGDSAPDDPAFRRIGKDFGAMLTYLLGDVTAPNVQKPTKLFDFWAIYQAKPSAKSKKGVVLAWQKIVDEYRDVTYYKAVYDLGQNTKILADKWSQEDMNKFGALGVGSGGFGPLYMINFVDIVRLFANGWEDNQELLQTGIVSLVDSFNDAISKTVKVRLNQKISAIVEKPITVKTKKAAASKYTLSFASGIPDETFDSVIVATTTRAMSYMGLTVDGVTNIKGKLSDSILSQGPKVAIRNLHLMNSSKLFVTTKSKFWYADNNKTKKDLPFNMQTDELMRGLYCMNYDSDIEDPKTKKMVPNTKGKGVVLISYVWGDDSTKLLALSAEERYQQFLEGIRKIDPTFADLLDEQREKVSYIDWESTTNMYGAFKLNYPGQEQDNHDAFFQFQAKNQGLFLAGDSVSWAGGWLEGAMPTGVNAACAAAQHVGATVIEGSPLTGIPEDMYRYQGN
jgi:tryptophan 2-monooxygenase